MNFESIMTWVGGPIITFIVSAGTFWLGRKKTNAEVKSNELDNVVKAVAIWQKMAEDMATQLEQRDSLIEELKSKIDVLSIQIGDVNKQNLTVIKENKELIQKLNYLSKQVENFQKQA